jgi:hypothetical protein
MRMMLRKIMHELGKKLILFLRPLEILNIRLQQQSVFQGINLSNIVLGAGGCHISEPKPTRNDSKNTIRSC